ncbi:hypothetical protein [Dysgonomonas termitidis]|uniref:AraC family transcriptional regulator n=1 Tax=Dysgonomonas termitidis TaxID=1516126 RepID=A0ABV9KPT8_9BACT
MKATELNRNEIHATDFKNWAKSRNINVLDSLPGVDLKTGDKVTFTNGYGVKFEGHTILGFRTPLEDGRCVYLDIDCYWFAVKPEELTVENKEDEPATPVIGQYVFDTYYNCKKQVKGIANGLFYIGSDHEPVHRHEFIFPLPR